VNALRCPFPVPLALPPSSSEHCFPFPQIFLVLPRPFQDLFLRAEVPVSFQWSPPDYTPRRFPRLHHNPSSGASYSFRHLVLHGLYAWSPSHVQVPVPLPPVPSVMKDPRYFPASQSFGAHLFSPSEEFLRLPSSLLNSS